MEGEHVKEQSDAVDNEPSLRKALEKAESQRLKKRTPNGNVDFNICVGVHQVASESVGLAVYFRVLQEFTVLLLVLSLLAIPPLFKAFEVNKLTGDRTVEVNLDNGNTVEKECSWPMTTTSFAIVPTLGSFCSKEYSTIFSCPSVCKVKGIDEQTLLDECGATKENGVIDLDCSAHYPKDSLQEDKISDQARLDNCTCDESTLKVDPNSVPPLFYGFILIGQILFLIFLYYLNWLFGRLSRDLDEKTASASDYSLLIKGLSREFERKRESLASFFARYGEIGNVTRPIEDSKHIYWGKMLSKHDDARREISHPRRGVRCEGMLQKLFSCIGGPPTNAKAIDKKREKAKKGVQEEEQRVPKSSTFAFVTYNYAAAKKRALAKLSGGLCSSKPKFEGRSVRVVDPPEPSDVKWENFSNGEAMVMVKELFISYPIVTLILAVSIGLQFVVGIVKNVIRQESLKDKITNDFADTDASTGVGAQALSVITGALVLIFNFVGKILINIIVALEKQTTQSEVEAALVYRIGMFQVLNGVIPVLGSAGGLFSLYMRGAFAETAFWVQVIASFGPDLYSLLDPFRILRRCLGTRLCRTQEFLDRVFEPDEFALSQHYGDVLKNVGMALVFGPMTPIAFIIGLVGVVATILTDRYVAFKRAKRPKNINEKAAHEFLRVLWHIGFLQALCNFLVYFPKVKPAHGIFTGTFIAYTLLMLTPAFCTTFLWRCCCSRKKDDEPLSEWADTNPYRELVATGPKYSWQLHDDSHEVFNNLMGGHVHPNYFKAVYAPYPPSCVDEEYYQHYKDAYSFFDEIVPADTSTTVQSV